MMHGWIKGTATVSIIHPSTAFPYTYTLGCMVAKTTNVPAVALVITIHKQSDTKVELKKAAYNTQ